MYHGGSGMGHLHGAIDTDDDEQEFGKVYDHKVIARLPRYLVPVKRWLIIGGIGMTARTAGQLAIPYLVMIATDRFIQTGNLGGLNIISLIFIAASLFIWGGQYLQNMYLALAGQSVLYKMRTEMFDHLHEMSLSFYDHHKVGKLMSRVQNDVNQLGELLTSGVLNILFSAITLIAIVIIMLVMNAKLALLTLTVVPVLAIIIIFWQKYARRAFIKVRRAIAVVNGQLQESMSGVRVIQSLSRENVNAQQFDGANKAHLDANLSAARLQAMMMPVVQIMTGVAFGFLIIFGGYQVLDGTMQIGVLLGFLLYVQRFFDPVLELTMQYTELQRSMASGTRIFELLDIKPEIEDSPQAIELERVKGKMKFDSVSFSYTPGVEVLHNINLEIQPGETIAIVGRTGAGKSSLTNLASRFYEASEGNITIDGHNIREVSQQSLRNQIGTVPQEAFLFSGTVEENIRYGHIEASHDEVVDAAKIVGAHDYIAHMQHGYDTQVGERGGNLSAGQRQLICLARAVLADPPILILDEATSSVDTNAERVMQKSIKQLTKGRTCLIIAHRLSTITSADRIVVLEQGEIVETGSHRQLLDKQGLYAQMYQTLSAT